MTQNPIKVSILIANFNNSKYIAETLDSAIAQLSPIDSMPRFNQWAEIIIVDDCSTDDSISVIRSYMSAHQDIPIYLYQNEMNLGCGGTKRRCVELSQGEFFIFLDSDDALLPEAIQSLYYPHAQKKYSIVYASHYFCNENLEVQSISSFPGKIPANQTNLSSKSGHITHPALCRRAFYDQTEGINPNYRVCEDTDFYCKMEEVAPVYYVGLPLEYYRHHKSNTSWNPASNIQNHYWILQMAETTYRRRRKNGFNNISWCELQKRRFEYHRFCAKEYWHAGNYIYSIVEGFWASLLYIFVVPRLFERLMHFIRRKVILPARKNKLKNHTFSIIANDCIGGVMYHDLGEKFRTPTINLGILESSQFLTFCEHLDYYLSLPIEPYDNGEPTPFGILRGKYGDVIINMLHYKSFADGKMKWEERKQRINRDNIFIVFHLPNPSTSILKRFNTLPYEHKVCYTTMDGLNVIKMPIDYYSNSYYSGKILDYDRIGLNRQMEVLDYVAFLNGEGVRRRCVLL